MEPEVALKPLFNEIVDAIHEKDGLSDGIHAYNFPERIRSIPAGGNALTSIEIASPPDRVSYFIGEVFDPTGIVVVATFDNGETLTISNDDLTFSPLGELEEGMEAITVSYQFGDVIKTVMQAIIVSVDTSVVGVSWDGSPSTKWSRTDGATLFTDPVIYKPGVENCSSPFDDIMPWAGMVVSERIGGTMVAIPKFWYKLTMNTNNDGFTIQISPTERSDFYVSPAHMDRGDGHGERDVIYIGRYLCNTSFKSVTNQTPATNYTIAESRSAIRNTGSGCQPLDFTTRFTIWLLYLVEMADWDSQSCIGYGRPRNTTGYTDNMPYHTGTTLEANGGTQYRNIEGLWDYIGILLDGVYFDSGENTCVSINPSHFGNFSHYNVRVASYGENPTKFVINEDLFPFFYQIADGGSSTSYTCDDWRIGDQSNCLMQAFNRGSSGKDNRNGLFFNTYDIATFKSSNIGSRLIELPN